MKTVLRREFLARREQISTEHASIAGAVIKDTLFRHPAFSHAARVMFYVAKGKEVPTLEMIRASLAIGKKVCVPVMEQGEIIAAEIGSVNELGSRDAFGILVPSEIREVEKAIIDLVLVPVVCFDDRGHRIGYGFGAYDRFLSGYSGAKIGLAYAFQQVDKIEADERDVALDEVLTQKK